MRIRRSLGYAARHRAEASLWVLRWERDLLGLAYARFYHWVFFRPFFASRMRFIGKAGVRLNPSTHLSMMDSRLVVENGILSVGYVTGQHSTFKDSCRLRLEHSTLRTKGNVQIRPGVNIWAMNANLVIGNGTVINGPGVMVSKAGIEIGERCLIARNTTIMDCDLHRHAVAGKKPEDVPKKIVIGDHCWIGHNVTILKGVAIGEGSIVGAHSVVLKDVEPHTMVVGVPARQIKENVVWEE